MAANRRDLIVKASKLIGFHYLNGGPVEQFQVPDQSDPITACAALLAFAAYPSVSQFVQRQQASYAFQAWIYRAILESGKKVRPPERINRRHLPPAMMRKRVYKASGRIEHVALDLVGLGMDMTFFRSDGPMKFARLFGSYFKTQHVSVQIPQKVDNDIRFLKDHLARRKSKAALESDDTLKDFRRRTWKVFLPALPLLTAIHIDCLKFDAHKQTYGVAIPGYPRRYLAISLLCNPQHWIDSVVLNTSVRRALMTKHFPPDTFADILALFASYVGV